jgi:hypothetical protein
MRVLHRKKGDIYGNALITGIARISQVLEQGEISLIAQFKQKHKDTP